MNQSTSFITQMISLPFNALGFSQTYTALSSVSSSEPNTLLIRLSDETSKDIIDSLFRCIRNCFSQRTHSFYDENRIYNHANQTLSDRRFRETDLSTPLLNNTQFENCIFSYCDINGSGASDSKFVACRFYFSNVNYPDASTIQFINFTFTHCSIDTSSAQLTTFQNCSFLRQNSISSSTQNVLPLAQPELI